MFEKTPCSSLCLGGCGRHSVLTWLTWHTKTTLGNGAKTFGNEIIWLKIQRWYMGHEHHIVRVVPKRAQTRKGQVGERGNSGALPHLARGIPSAQLVPN